MKTSIFGLIKETIILLWINLKVKIGNLIEWLRVIIHYYPHWHFCKIDAALLLSYLFTNPFRVSKRFLIHKGEQEIYAYGETPLTTLDQIAHQCQIQAHDVVFELGCGRGRTCFWLNQFIGCSVVGIDYVPTFIKKAQTIKDRFQIKKVSFRFENFFQTDFTGATVIYLYGTCLSADAIQLLTKRFKPLLVGTKVITVSYALTDYLPTAPFEIAQQFQVSFTWGQADVYLQIKNA